jgi:endonuclease/exonuclease/phosphatase family metal-dependent hydrolase
VKLVSYNIQYGIGLDGRLDLDRIADTVGGADIIALQEVTRNFERNGGIDMVAELQRRLPGHFSVYGPAMDVEAGSRIVDGRALDRRLQFGNMVMSRHPILSSRNLLLPRTRTFDILNLQRGAMEALILSPAGPIRVYSVHLDHVSGDERARQIAWLKDKVLAYPLEGGAVTGAIEFGSPEPPHPEDFVLMGDFNMEPESPEYRLMTGSVDAFFGRRPRASDPVDAEGHLAPHAADAYSWTDMKDNALRKQLDYCFVSAGLAGRVRMCRTDRDARGSDHQPVRLELNSA